MRLLRHAAAVALAAGVAWPSHAADTAAAAMRIGMPIVADTLDPARANNGQALVVSAGMHEPLYAFDPLASPPAIVPLTAAAMPEVSTDYRMYTVRVRPGIYFTPHARFGKERRELVAADYAYTIRRLLDPKLRSPSQPLLDGKIQGLDELAKRAREAGQGLDYDAALSGLETVERYTLRITLNSPDPYFPFLLASMVLGAVAREVVEAEGENYGLRPVGTGAFIVSAFSPGNRIVLARNPQFRELHWEDLLTPASRAATTKHPMHGRKLPGLDRIELTSTPENSAELLALRRGELDLIYLGQPGLATRNGRLRDDLARDGIELVRYAAPYTLLILLNMRDPVVGGNAQQKIALRRAIFMAFDDDEAIRVLDAGISTVRHQVVPPGIEGHVAGYRSPNMFDPAAANALLDRFGYRRGNDGMRRNPDGNALTLSLLGDPRTHMRQRAEFIKRMTDRIGVRVTIEVVQPSEYVRRLASCRHTIAIMDWQGDIPDGIDFLTVFQGRNVGSANFSCYVDPEFDAVYARTRTMSPGPARTELFRSMQARIDAYAPARPMPLGDLLFLKRKDVVGPFGTMNDWLQVVTLARSP